MMDLESIIKKTLEYANKVNADNVFSEDLSKYLENEW